MGDDDYTADDLPVEPTDVLHWVGLYLVERAYGGPEEGGWWYDAGQHAESADYHAIGIAPAAYLSAEEAIKARDAMQAATDISINVGRPEISSTLSRGRYQAHLFQTPLLPRGFPAHRPHYE